MAAENKNNIIAGKENEGQQDDVEYFEVKTDCFAYKAGKSDKYACTALNDLYCRKEECGFYKPKKN